MTQWEPPAADPGLKGVSSIREPSRAERTIGRRAAETRATVPDLELRAEVDVERAVARAASQGCSFTALLVHACALALREHPRANAAYRDGRFELYSRINVAVTMPTEDAFVAPTLLDADTRTLGEIETELTRRAARAQAGELTPPELAGATFTLTDLGPQKITSASALIVPPQAAGLAAGAIRRVPVVREEAVVPGLVVSLTLACDSRILFGASAARFLAAIAQYLETAQP